MKTCPFCEEEIEDAAVVCRACNRSLTEVSLQGNVRPPWGIPLAFAGALLSVASGALGVLGTLLLWIGLVGAIAKGHLLVRVVGSLVLTILIATTISDLTGSRPPTPTALGSGTVATALTEPTQSDSTLAIVSSRGYEEGGYHFVEGEVTNLSSMPLEAVTAVVTWYTEDGAFVTTETAPIEHDPILPGQTSPFKAAIRTNLTMVEFSVEFKQHGQAIATRDDSKTAMTQSGS